AGPSCLVRRVRDDEGLLCLDHPTGVVSVDRILREGRESEARRLEDPGARDAALGLEKDESQAVKADDPLQLPGQKAEELLRVAAGRDRFGNRKQSSEALRQGEGACREVGGGHG